jgi:hypothetical protein
MVLGSNNLKGCFIASESYTDCEAGQLAGIQHHLVDHGASSVN